MCRKDALCKASRFEKRKARTSANILTIYAVAAVSYTHLFQLVAFFQKCVPALDHDTAFGLHFVKIKNQDAAVNSKITSFRFFLNAFPHLSV